MSSLQVHIEALERLADRLSGAADELRAVLRKLDHAGPNGLGTDRLDDACHDLQCEWGHGVREIERLSGGVADRLRAAARAYQATEDAITQAAGGTP